MHETKIKGQARKKTGLTFLLRQDVSVKQSTFSFVLMKVQKLLQKARTALYVGVQVPP